MFFMLSDLQTYFTNLGYEVEVDKQIIYFHKEGNYIGLPIVHMEGTLEHVQEEVERRFSAGIEYAKQQIFNS
jgi:hypothetical protein